MALAAASRHQRGVANEALKFRVDTVSEEFHSLEMERGDGHEEHLPTDLTIIGVEVPQSKGRFPSE